MTYIRTLVLPPTHLSEAELKSLCDKIQAAVERVTEEISAGQHIVETDLIGF